MATVVVLLSFGLFACGMAASVSNSSFGVSQFCPYEQNMYACIRFGFLGHDGRFGLFRL
jgi:hypothetical protein